MTPLRCIAVFESSIVEKIWMSCPSINCTHHFASFVHLPKLSIDEHQISGKFRVFSTPFF